MNDFRNKQNRALQAKRSDKYEKNKAISKTGINQVLIISEN